MIGGGIILWHAVSDALNTATIVRDEHLHAPCRTRAVDPMTIFEKLVRAENITSLSFVTAQTPLRRLYIPHPDAFFRMDCFRTSPNEAKLTPELTHLPSVFDSISEQARPIMRQWSSRQSNGAVYSDAYQNTGFRPHELLPKHPRRTGVGGKGYSTTIDVPSLHD